MKDQTKRVLMWGGTMAVGLLAVWAAMKNNAAQNGATVSNGGALNLGAPDINIIGGQMPATFNVQTQPAGINGVGGSTQPVVMPVLNNYNTTQNSGCNSCSNAPSAYYASAIAANEAITSAMMQNIGYRRLPNGQLINTSDQYALTSASDPDQSTVYNYI